MRAEPRKPSLILPVAGAALLLLAGYSGAYYAMVSPEPAAFVGGELRFAPDYFVGGKCPVGETWRTPTGPLVTLFAPMNWLDCWLRPDEWRPRRVLRDGRLE